MAIRTVKKSSGGYRVSMTRCPVCGQRFAPQARRATHFLEAHTPEEFGL